MGHPSICGHLFSHQSHLPLASFVSLHRAPTPLTFRVSPSHVISSSFLDLPPVLLSHLSALSLSPSVPSLSYRLDDPGTRSPDSNRHRPNRSGPQLPLVPQWILQCGGVSDADEYQTTPRPPGDLPHVERGREKSTSASRAMRIAGA